MVRPGYVRAPDGGLVPAVTFGDFGALDLNLSAWLQGWGNVADKVKNVAGGVSTVTQAAQMGLDAQRNNVFQPSAADMFAQRYNTLAYVTPGGDRTLVYLAVGIGALAFLAMRKKGRA